MSDPGSPVLMLGPALLAVVLAMVGLKQYAWNGVGKAFGFATLAGMLALLLSFVTTLTIGWAVSASGAVIVSAAIASSATAALIVVGSAALARGAANG